MTNSGGASGTTAGTLMIGTFGTTTASGVFSGLLQNGNGGAMLNLVKNGSGVESLTGLNTYTGVTTIDQGVLAVTTLANGGQPSSIGQSSNAAGNLVFNNGGTLMYTGAGTTDNGVTVNIYQTTQTPSVSIDRLFTLAGNGTIDSSGSYGNNLYNAAGAQNNAALVLSNTGAIAFAGTGPLR